MPLLEPKWPRMLFCETAGGGRSDAEDLAVFASQLAALGVPARVGVGSVPENPGRNLQFDLAPRLTDGGLRPGDGLALLAADRLTDDALVRLRRLADGIEVTVRAFGCFARPQIALGVRARLSYVFGREPELLDVTPADPDAATSRRRSSECPGARRIHGRHCATRRGSSSSGRI